jgi:hypothetical protein
MAATWAPSRPGRRAVRLPYAEILLLFPVALLAVGLVLLALVRRQVVDWHRAVGPVASTHG